MVASVLEMLLEQFPNSPKILGQASIAAASEGQVEATRRLLPCANGNARGEARKKAQFAGHLQVLDFLHV